MKVPLSWLEEYVKLPKDRDLLTSKLTMAGHMLDKIEKVEGYTVVDLELRGNRADCYSIYGIAREVSALFDHKLTPPADPVKLSTGNIAARLQVNSKYVKRVMMSIVTDLKIQKSPKWLVSKLKAYGIDSINNIVDLTNYVMIETGEPMHAFDLAKIGRELTIRLAKANEPITTFQGKVVKLTEDDLVWANQEGALSIAGALGSKKHSVSDKTKTILIEAANYDRANIRRTIHRHNLLTEAGIRHEKELDPTLVEIGIKRFLYLVDKNKWGRISTKAYDHYPKPPKARKIVLDVSYLQNLSGMDINSKQVIEIAKKLNFIVVNKSEEKITLEIPLYRTDIEEQEDIIEEVLRIVGYEQIPTRRLSLEVPDNITPKIINFEDKLRDSLISLGFDEIITLPFVNEDKVDLNNKFSLPVKVVNRPSPNVEFMRTTMLTNLYDTAVKVINERGTEVRMFEIGKTYYAKADKYLEEPKAGLIYWQNNNSNYLVFKGFIETFLNTLGIDAEFTKSNSKALNNSFAVLVNKKESAWGGQYKDCWYIEFNITSLIESAKELPINLWPKYPPQIEDITIEIPLGVEVGKIVSLINQTKLVSSVELVDTYKNRYTFRIYYQHPEKTLSGKEVEKVRGEIIKKLQIKYQVRVDL